jgi:segregation and condensation protein A
MSSEPIFNYDEFIDKKDAKSQGIGILVEMAKQGKIDPWQIDIIDITNKYLAYICNMKSQDLRLTGQTFLFASMLIKLQSNVLEGVELTDFTAQEEEPTFDEDGFIVEYPEDDYVPTNNIISLEEVLQRRTSVRLNHNRIVTLKDLIRQLEFYEKLEQRQALHDAHERAKNRVRSYARLTADEIVNLAHEEYIADNVLKLKANLEQIFEQNEKIELNDLLPLGMDKMSAYIALLFLAAESDYDLEQEEFYSDLYIVKGSKEFEEFEDSNVIDFNKRVENIMSVIDTTTEEKKV